MKNINKIAFDEAVLIGNELIKDALSDENGIYWETLEFDTIEKKHKNSISEDIYIGNAGILLYLIELYDLTKAPDLINAINLSSKWLINYCDIVPVKSYGFYIGRGGVSYVLCRAGEITGNYFYIEKAIQYMKGCAADILAKRYSVNFDLLSGVSGSILALTHLLSYSNEIYIRDSIVQLVKLLIEHMQVFPHSGIVWNRMSTHMYGLCGLSHGSAGISWVLFEVARVFNHVELQKLAFLSYYYEQSFFDERKNNWPDFRTGLYDSELVSKTLDQLIKGEADFLYTPSYMSAWCHGAPGIGLTRLKFYDYTGHRNFKKEIENAVETTLNDTQGYDNYSICHGISGNMAFILKYLNTPEFSLDNKFEDLINSYIKLGIDSRKKRGFYKSGLAKKDDFKDNSLFTGAAGVGYYMLMNTNTSSSLDILCPSPTVDTSMYELDVKINLTEIFCLKLFPLTMQCIKSLDESKYADIISKNLISNSTKKIFLLIKNIISNFLKTMTEYRPLLLDVFRFEKIKFKYNHPEKGDAFNGITEVLVKKNNASLIHLFPNILVEFNSTYIIVKTKYKWDDYYRIGLKNLDRGNFYFMMKTTLQGTRTIYIEPQCMVVLDYVKKFETLSVNALINRMIDKRIIGGSDNEIQFMYSQVYELVKAEILIIKSAEV